jgi:transglutaminase-like putative cysteine protease
MRYIFLIFILLLMPLAYAGDEWIYSSSYFLTQTQISSSASLQTTSSSATIDYVKAELYFFPKDDERQDIVSVSTDPDSTKTDGYLEFTWNNPSQDEVSFMLDTTLKTYKYQPRIASKIPFPITEIDKSLDNYTQPTNLIDSTNPTVVSLASELASGRDDLYDVVFSLSDWVLLNVQYNLSTFTEKASQKASWVLQNKYGVCDEISTLFVALCRSLGIPARYVGGLAYTNWQGINNFGPHAWAEVYFPTVGWVPFDITYGEFGYVDATHILLKEYNDPDESSTRFEWRGRDIDVETHKLNMQAKILETGPAVDEPIFIRASALKNEVGFGSYNIVSAEIQNLAASYISSSVGIAKSAEITIIGDNRKHFYLKPLEKKTISWIVRVDQNLDSDYSYTFPLSAYSLSNISDMTDFTAKKEDPIYSYDDVKAMLAEFSEEEKKVYSQNVSLYCKPNSSYYYPNENVSIKCTLKNTGNVKLDKIKACLLQQCYSYDLGIHQEKSFIFFTSFETEKEYNAKITATNDLLSKAAFVPIAVYEKPRLDITNIDNPESVSYEDNYTISFFINKSSRAIAYNVKVHVEKNGMAKDWSYSQLNTSQQFILKLKGEDLSFGDNPFTMAVSYEDKNKQAYKAEENVSVTLGNVTFWQRVTIVLRNIAIKIDSFFGQ